MRIKKRAILTLIGNTVCSLVYAWSMFALFFKTYFTNFIKFQETVWSNLPSELHIVNTQISDSNLRIFCQSCITFRKCIQNPVKRLRWRLLRKKMFCFAFSCQSFLLNASS